MTRRLPAFATLRSFEAAARHCSFTRAASELGVTPSAISHQVKQLEDQLGVALFQRTTGGLEVSEPAREYLTAITSAFDAIEVATSRIARSLASRSLTINLSPSLAALWLLPGLHAYQSANPAVDVRLITSMKPIDFTGSDIDLSVRYLREPPADMRSQFLFEEIIFPACSPGLSASVNGLSMAEALGGATLVHCDTQPDEWRVWRAAHGQPEPERSQHIRVDNRLLALEAALNSLGFVMARTPYADHSLRAGRLVAPFSETISTGWSYYLVWPERKAKIVNLTRFVAWIREFCAGVHRLPHPGAVL